MLRVMSVILVLFALSGCGESSPPGPSAGANAPGPAPVSAAAPARTLSEARKVFKSKITKQLRSGEEVEEPPKEIFTVVKYPSPAGELAAYLSAAPVDGKKRPAIVWITGGDCNTIGNVWDEPDPTNEQTASAYRLAGVVMMFPSLRDM